MCCLLPYQSGVIVYFLLAITLFCPDRNRILADKKFSWFFPLIAICPVFGTIHKAELGKLEQFLDFI